MVNRVEAFFYETKPKYKLKQINLHAVAVFVSLPFILPKKKKVTKNSIFLKFLSIIHVQTNQVFKAKQAKTNHQVT